MMRDSAAHADLMDGIYRHQRLIYDLTRKYFLLGRDHLIDELDVRPDDTVLEIGCGTGRNLAKIAQRYPSSRLFGFDLSDEMLKSAHRMLKGRATLERADACGFDGRQTFGVNRFDRILFSYSLSMIPCWQPALEAATNHLAPSGSLHVVDFGGQKGMPVWFGRLLRAWLARFHVSPCAEIADVLSCLASEYGGSVRFEPLCRDYACYGVLRRAQLPNFATET